MSKKDEAMKLALKAFETLTQYNMVRANIFRRFEPTCTGDYVDLREFREKAESAITALREALAEQPDPKAVDCHATGVCVQSGLRAEQPAQQRPYPNMVLFAVEEAIRNGGCPWQIESAFEEYEAGRKAAIGITKGGAQ